MAKRYYTYFLLFFLFSLSIKTFSQSPVDVDEVTDAQVEQFMKDMEERGMSEMEIEAAALANGYTSEDVAKIRERINRLKTGTNNLSQPDNKTKREQIGELAERTPIQVDEKTEVSKKKEVFGREIFNNKSLSFEPNLRLPTPKDYVLGTDDQLKIDITGYAYQHYDATVSPEGTIKLESLSPIHVSGLTIEAAKVKIVERLKLLFGGLRNGKLNADVTLGDVRSIKVTIVGEVENPGTYTVSAFASAFNALYLAGGPGEKGSFRNIKLLRDNKEKSKIDLYPFLTKGEFVGNERLLDQDVIFVPMAESKVEFEGKVRREGVYELKVNETLEDALFFAGGPSDQAYLESINITRNTKKEKKLLTVDGDRLGMYALQNGDRVYIGAILDRYENKVEITGAVFRPGEYSLSESLSTVKELIRTSEGLREDAFLERVLIVREREDLDPEIISFNLKEILNGKKGDIDLKKNDQVIVKSVTELRELRRVEIKGSVNQPGEFDFAEGMSVEDLILFAGGFREGASKKRIEIAKRLYNDESTNETVEVILIDSDDLFAAKTNISLSPFDKVFVRDLPNYEEQKLVSITGEVNYPGVYTILRREERISDLLERAGGLRNEAYAEGARFFREGDLVALDLKRALSNSDDLGDLILSEGDSLIIPKIQEVVKLSGQVLNPTIVAYQPELSFSDYIAQAGGVTDSAFVRKAYVRYANGLTDRTRSFLGIKNYPKVQRGMEVIIPKRNRVKWSSAEKISISSGMVSLSAVLLTLFRLL